MNEQWHQRQQPPAGPAGTLGPPPGTGHAPQPAVLVHELVAVAAAGGERAEKCARRLAAALPPRARSVLLDALAEADTPAEAAGPPTGEDGPYGDEGGDALSLGGPEHPLPAARSHLSLLPAYRAAGPDPQTGTGDGGDGGVWPEPRSGPPAAVIRLRFADAIALERAGACFEGACGDPVTGTLQIPADAGVEAVRAVLAALDAAALAPESFTVHSNELDDVFAAFTGLL
ncbi:hypothetical protein ACFRIC_00455 [Streptomyces sp. NPDC056738]|uniref:hypothetical protein n=1 Tax=Streptomyces sp. NPDC056738 TaxID=3345933 RepID=UPI0036C2A740